MTYASVDKLMEDYSKEVAKKAAQEVREEIATSLLNDGKYIPQDIALLTKLPVEKVNQLNKKFGLKKF